MARILDSFSGITGAQSYHKTSFRRCNTIFSKHGRRNVTVHRGPYSNKTTDVPQNQNLKSAIYMSSPISISVFISFYNLHKLHENKLVLDLCNVYLRLLRLSFVSC
jgi:hypothetical protein